MYAAVCGRKTRKIVEAEISKQKVCCSCREWDRGAAQAALSILPLSVLLMEDSQPLPWGTILPLPGDTGRGLYPQAVLLLLAQLAICGYHLVFLFFPCILGAGSI